MAIDAGYTITALSGKDGQSGDSISVQYAPTDTTPQGQRHDTFQSGDKYMWQKIGDGSWSSAMKIVGEDGKNAITMTSATTPSGEYEGQIGVWQGQIYKWTSNAWVNQNTNVPTDAVLHYSFDEVPDYPDGTATLRKLNDFTTTAGFDTAGQGVLSVANGELINTVTNGVFAWIRRPTTTPSGIVKIKVRATKDCDIRLMYYINSDYAMLARIQSAKAGQSYTITSFLPVETPFLLIFGVMNQATDFQLILTDIYIGNGSYSTPIIDNVNGEWNSISQSGVAVQGVSGKGLKCLKNNYVNCGNAHLSNNFTFSIWIKPDNADTTQTGESVYIPDQLMIRNGAPASSVTTLVLVIYTENNTQLNQILGNLLEANVWTHLVITKNGTSCKVYFNGTLKSSYTLANGTLRQATGSMRINKSWLSNDRPQSYDDLLIFDRALSDTEVQALYQNKANTPKYYTMSDYSIEQIDDDNVVDHLTEKPQLLSKWLEIYNAKNVSSALPTSNVSASGEYKGVIDSANEVGVIETDAVQAYITASNALRSALWGTNGYLVDMNKDSALSGSLDSLFSTYRQTLQKARTVISEQQASSASALTIVNSNSFCLIPVNAGGTVTTYENTGLRLQVFNGVTQLTPKASSATLSKGQWKVTANGSNITAGSQTVGNGYIDFGNVSALNADTAVITFTITAFVNGVTNTLYTTQKFSKSKEGADGRIYTLLPDYTAIKKSADGSVLTPSSVTVQAKSWTGSSTPAPYSSGDLKAFENDVQIGSTVSQGNTITVSPTGSYPVVIKLFVHGTNTLLDTLTIPVLQEVKGDTGRGLVSSVEKYKLSASLTEPFNESTASSWTDTASSVPTAQLPYLHHAVLQTYSEAPLNEYGDDVIIREYVTNGTNGTSTRYSSASATSSTTSIALNTITGSTAVVGDVIIANSLLFVVTAVGSTNATVQYKQSLKGADNKGISVLLSNQNPNVPSNSDGSSPVLTNTLTNVRVYENTTELKYDASSTANGYYKITVTATGCTHTSITDKGNYAQVNAISAMSADSATRNLAISGKHSDGTSFSFNVVQTITKEKQGLDGYSPSASVTKSGGVATITVTDKTGTTQETVSDGDDGLNVSLSTDSIDVLCGNGDGLASGAQSATIKIYARKGSSRVAVPVSAITVPNWTRASYGVQFSKTAGTSSADGYVTVSIDNGATLNSGATAIVTGTLSVTVENQTFSFTLTFKKVTKGCYLGRTGATPSSATVTVYTSTTELTGGGVNKFAFAGDYVSVIAGNDIGKIFMYNGASWVADNNVGHGTSAFSDLLMIPDSLPNDSSSELILKRLISEEVLAKRISALEVNFQKFVASFKESGDQVGDLCISMGKNPKNAIDEDLNFIIQSYKGNITKNTTDDVAVWKKEFCTNKSEENQIDFIMNGDIKLNGNINIGATSLYLGADVEELIKCNGNGTNSSNGFNIVSVFYEGSIYIFNAKANESVIVSKWVYDGSNNPQFVQESKIATKGLVYYATVYENNIYVSFSTGVYRYNVSAKTFTTITTTYKPYIMNVVNGLLNLSNDSTFAFYNGSSVITKTPWEDCVSWLCEFSQDLLIACNGNLNITNGSSYSTTRMAFYDKNFTFLGYQQIRGKSVTTKTGTSKTIGYATGIFASNGIIFSSIICSDESHMLVASYDCGKTWKELLSGGSFLTPRCFSDNNIIVLYSTSSVMYSIDGGKSFTISPLRYLSNYIFGGVCCAKIDNYNDILVPLTHENIYNRLGFLRIRQRNLVENTAYHIIASSIKDINRPFGVNYYTIPGLSDFDHVYSVGDIVYNGSPAIGNFYKCLKSCKITEHGFGDTEYWQNDIGDSGYIAFSNGLIIQWGRVTSKPSSNPTTVSGLIFSTSSYNVSCVSYTDYSPRCFSIVSQTASSFTVAINYGTGSNASPFQWVAIGY